MFSALGKLLAESKKKTTHEFRRPFGAAGKTFVTDQRYIHFDRFNDFINMFLLRSDNA